MKLTKRMLSLPPFLSTPWRNVLAMHVKPGSELSQATLIVQLTDGTLVEIPGLPPQVLYQIFAAHAEAVESGGADPLAPSDNKPTVQERFIGVPFRIGSGGTFEHMGTMLQHDLTQADAPDLPPQVLSRVAGIAQILGAEVAETLPQAETGCNCFHCQIARAIHRGADANREQRPPDDEVTDADLRFRTWDIEPCTEDKDAYYVTNAENRQQRYTVHLGETIGCTCGEKNCIHIQAVLKS
jgi:hypothetical protein